MEKRVLTIWSTKDRAKVANWLSNYPDGTRVQFSPSTRTLEQNDRLHAMIGEVSKKATHHGQKYNIADWKVLFLEALGAEQKLAPSLTGKGIVPLGRKTSQLTISQCSEMMDFIECWCAENNIELTDPKYESAA